MSARPIFTAIVRVLLKRDVDSVVQTVCVGVSFLGVIIASVGKQWEKRENAKKDVERRVERWGKTFAMREVGLVN